jgi:hypothetical protein
MRVFNLLNDAVRVQISDGEFSIPRNSSVGLTRPFKFGEIMSVFVHGVPYRTVKIENNDDLYIGNITGKIYDYLYNQMRVNVNPTQGLPWLKIWNKTNKILSLNGNICIQPNSYHIYLGRDHFGVPMGLVLKDMDGIYPDFFLTQPISDLFYGDISYKEKLPLFSDFDNTKVESLIRYFN